MMILKLNIIYCFFELCYCDYLKSKDLVLYLCKLFVKFDYKFIRNILL